MKGYIHSIESFGASDGPGVRSIVFLSGCPLRCRYCHNPDTWHIKDGKPSEACDVINEAAKYRAYWGKDGGITFSGGEPLLQPEFLKELLKFSREMNINTCIDTSGAPFLNDDIVMPCFDELAELCDLFIVDIKHMDPEKHRALTGRDNKPALEMLKRLSKLDIPVWIRHVLVPGLTDDSGNLKEMSGFISQLTNVRRVQVLPYHTLGIHKWEALGMKYTLYGTTPPSQEQVEAAERILLGKETN